MTSPKVFTPSVPLALFIGFASPMQAAVIYNEDFSTTTTQGLGTQATLGFFGPGFAAFDAIAVAANATVQNEELFFNSNTNNEFRGIGIVLDGASFVGNGPYSLQYDIVDFQLNSPFGSAFSDQFQAIVWTANGFVQGTSDGLVVNAQSGDVILSGPDSTASATQIASQAVSFQDSPNTGTFSLDFNYDGSEAVVIYLGAVSDGFPFPEITVDNISVSTASAVPEPTSVTLLALSFLAITARRRRVS